MSKKSKTDIKKISITHIEDLDGLGSQAILLRKFPNLECYQSFYSNFNESIKKIYNLNPDILYISDIGFNASFKAVFEILGKMNVYWFDHHLISESDEYELKKYVPNFIHSQDEVVAAELVQQQFLPNDDIAKKIAELAYFRDNNIKNNEADRLQAIIGLNQNDRDNIQKIVRLLSKGEFENPWFGEQYNLYLKKEQEEFKLLEKRVLELKTKEKKIVVSFSSFFATGKQTRYLLEKFDADIAFGVNPLLKLVSIRSKDINVKKIAWQFGGGGHYTRAGFTYTKPLNEKNEITKKFLDDLLLAVNKVLSNN
ncbi:MAG: hypothetical protein ACTSRG_03860 [Candidatus Helarchaeota archaeon]